MSIVSPENLCMNDVPARFREIPPKVRCSSFFGSTKKYLGARVNSKIEWPDYTSNVANWGGIEEHFQGIQRIGQYLILSGGIKTGEQRSQLIVINMETRSKKGPWALPRYGYSYKNPPPEDRIVKVVDIDDKKWHTGGIQAMDCVIAVSIYGDRPRTQGSEICYFDFTDPQHPEEIENIRLHREKKKSNAVALTRLTNGHYMTMVWDDENLDFHYSVSDDISHGFQTTAATVPKQDVGAGFDDANPDNLDPGGTFGYGTYQNINFVRDQADKMYFVATRNSEKASPTSRGKDFADLYEISWREKEGTSDLDYEAPPRISRTEHKQMYCYNQQCNFGAGAGIYIDDEAHLFLYGASHWLHGGNERYNFNEYSY